MIITEAQGNIHMRWRDKEGNRQSELDEDFKSYFYIERGEQQPTYFDFRRKGEIVRVRPTYDMECEEVNITGQPLVKVIVDEPQHVYDIRGKWDKTYEADISMVRKYCKDGNVTFSEYEYRKWYLDIETQVDGRYDGQINAITVYDNYDNTYYVMSWFPTEPMPDVDMSLSSGNTELKMYEDEGDMLVDFIKLMQECDPDIIIGWYIMGFDLPKILERIAENGLNPRALSPINEVKGCGYKRVYNTDYTNTTQVIKGRYTYCLMTTFERLWLDSQKGNLPSLALDYCSKLVLGEDAGKVEKGEQAEDFFKTAWLEKTQLFLEYNKVDVELMVRMDNEMNISENSIALQRLLQCPLDVTFYNSQMGATYFMRHAGWVAPTGVKGSKGKYEAAFVMSPEHEKTFGLHENVAVFDYKSLYPSMMAARNISWETKNVDRAGHFYDIDFSVPKTLTFWESQSTDVEFAVEPLGVLPKAVLSLMELRDSYKKKMRAATTDEEYRKWHSAQMATKRVVNAFYGVLAKDGFGWGDMEMAAAITASAREAMRAIGFKAREFGYEVIYGHTDSIFVKVRDVEDAKQLCIRLNDYVRKDVFNECVELEFEKMIHSFFLSKKKNRYCGYLSWVDGEYLDEPKFFVMGFEMKKSNETAVAKDFQSSVLKMVARGEPEMNVTKYAKNMYNKILKGDVNVDEVSKRRRLRAPLEDYKSIGGGTAGVYYHNIYLNDNEPISVGDSFYFYTVDTHSITKFPSQYEINGKVRNVEYIAAKKISDVIDNFPVAWGRIAEAEIVKKINLIYDSMEWDLTNVSSVGIQKKLDEWW